MASVASSEYATVKLSCAQVLQMVSPRSTWNECCPQLYTDLQTSHMTSCGHVRAVIVSETLLSPAATTRYLDCLTCKLYMR